MISAILVYNRIYNCETFVPLKYHPLHDPLTKKNAQSLQNLVQERFPNIPYAPRKALEKIAANVIECSDATFPDVAIHALESGTILHLIVLDIFALQDSVLEFFREFWLGTIRNQFQQDLAQIPVLPVCINQITNTQAEKLKALFNMRTRATFAPWFYEYEDDVKPRHDNFRPHKATQKSVLNLCVRAILDYRERLLEDLDLRGFILNFDGGEIELSPAFTYTPRYRAFSFTNYIAGVERFLFMDKTALAISQSIERFQDLLNTVCASRSRNSSRKQREEEIQRFLIRHPHFLYQNRYNKLWAQPQLRYGEQAESWVIPDFVAQSTVTHETAVLDLKLPNSEGLVKKHAEELTKRLIRAVEQVLGYKTIVDESTLPTNLGGDVCKIDEVSVIIGRMGSEINEARRLLAGEAAPLNSVKLIAYDDLIEIQQNVLEGIVLLSGSAS